MGGAKDSSGSARGATVSSPPVVRILGTPLVLTSYADLIGRCSEWGRDNVVTVDFSNTQIVTMRRCVPSFRETTDCVDHFIPDGMPLIWALNDRGAGLTDRVYGPTFMRKCLLEAPAERTHYFLGGSQECVGRLERVFKELRPAVRIVGRRDGYFGESEEAAIVEEINALSPDFIWVGLGTPKQQEWIRRNKPKLRRGVTLAVGFAFDVNAGTKRDAPAWMQKLGLTWVFRLCEEPRRLAARYFKWNSLFVAYWVGETLSGSASSDDV